MLPVGVDAPAIGVALLGGVRIAAAMPARRPRLVPNESTSRAVVGRDGRRPVGRAVVDDEHVRVGQLGVQFVEDVGQVVLLVPRGNEDDRVARVGGHHGDRSRSAHSRGGSDSVVSPRG